MIRGEALDELFAAGVRHLMVEGGSRILSAFLAAGLVDELIVYLAPTLLGSGTPALEDLGITTLADAQRGNGIPRPAGRSSCSAATCGCTCAPPWQRPPRHTAPAATNTSSDSTPLRTGADTAAGGN